jgi:hypothetical protein
LYTVGSAAVGVGGERGAGNVAEDGHNSPVDVRLRRAARGHFLTMLALGVLLGAPACSDDDAQIELAPLLPERDRDAEVPPLPEGARLCAQDGECDDGIECTRDSCANGRYCVNAANSSVCSDGVFCNGQELCDPATGCLASSPRLCNDGDVCTVDHCSEREQECRHDPRDFDGDGEVDWHCMGGTDCDDFDATRAQAVSEVCADAIDNDCDDIVDEAADCGSQLHDTCADALDVSAGGTFSVGLSGAKPDYAPSCTAAGAGDVAFMFTIKEPRDVTLIGRGLLSDGVEETAVVAVRSNCGDSGTEIDCSRGFPGQLRLRSLPAGEYFVIVSSALSAQALLEARFEPPTEGPTNTSCETALPLPVTGNARFEASFVDVGDDEAISCGFEGANDLVYSFRLEQPRDVEIAAASATGERMNFAIRTECDEPASTLRCVSDSPAWARLFQLPANTYYIILESSPAREVDFSLNVAFLDPSEPPVGQSCDTPVDLLLDTETPGSLANHQDLVEVHCGCSGGDCNLFLPDIIYSVEVEEPSDLALHVEGGSSLFAYDFRSACDDIGSQLSCSRALGNGGRIRNLAPGSYYLVLESPGAGNFTILAERLPPSVPVPVTGNDTCGTATEIPVDGGLFSGNTLDTLDHYGALCGSGALGRDAVFRLNLTTRAEVSAIVDAPFDSVLFRYADLGAGAATCVSQAEAACDDGGGTQSRLAAEILEPGAHYYVVDGVNSIDAGPYLFQVDVIPLGP